MVDTSKPMENGLHKLVEAWVSERKIPTLLLVMGHIIPPSTITTANELRGQEIPELDVILHTPGGLIEPAYKIVKILRKHAKKINMIVPSFAKSAGTLVCLSGETLMLNTTSELGPLDVQIAEHQEGDVDTYKSALNGFKALEQIQTHAIENVDVATQLILRRTRNRMRLIDVMKLAIEFSGNTSGCLYNQMNPKTITEHSRALDIGEQYGMRILVRYMGWEAEKAGPIIHRLVYDYPSHEFIIDAEELSELGFKVEAPKGKCESIFESMSLTLETQQLPEEDIKLFKPARATAKRLPTKPRRK